MGKRPLAPWRARRALVGRVLPEIAKLEAAGVVVAREEGASKYVSIDETSRESRLVRDLVLLAFGPKTLLETALEGVEGIDFALIFGSWARRYHGESGLTPNDIDVLVVGEPNVGKIYDAVNQVEDVIHKNVNVVVVAHAKWQSEDAPLIKQIKHERPVFLELTA